MSDTTPTPYSSTPTTASITPVISPKVFHKSYRDKIENIVPRLQNDINNLGASVIYSANVVVEPYNGKIIKNEKGETLHKVHLIVLYL